MTICMCLSIDLRALVFVYNASIAVSVKDLFHICMHRLNNNDIIVLGWYMWSVKRFYMYQKIVNVQVFVDFNSVESQIQL